MASDWVRPDERIPDGLSPEFLAMYRMARDYERRLAEAAAQAAKEARIAAAREMANKREPVGTELKSVIASLGLGGFAGCGCDSLAAQMDQWGVAGCEANRDTILAKLRENAAKLGWRDKLKAAAKATLSGLAFKLDPFDPAPGLLDEAIARVKNRAAPPPPPKQLPPPQVVVPQPMPPIEPFEPKSDRAVVTCAVGSEGQEMLSVSRPAMEAYAAKIGADFRIIRSGGWPGFPIAAKFRFGQHLRLYRRAIFFDADVLVRPSCPDLFEAVPDGSLAMRDDRPDLDAATADHFDKNHVRIAAEQGLPPVSPPLPVWNTGVVVAESRHAELFDPPSAPFIAHHCYEQDWVTIRSHLAGESIYRLGWEFNCQWWPKRGFEPARLAKAHIVHFAGMGDLADHAARMRLMRELASPP